MIWRGYRKDSQGCYHVGELEIGGYCFPGVKKAGNDLIKVYKLMRGIKRINSKFSFQGRGV